MVELNVNKQANDKDIKIRKKGNSYEARKTIDLSKIYGFEITKRISKTALSKEMAVKLLKQKEKEELLNAAEKARTNNINSKLDYEKLHKAVADVGQDFKLKSFVTKMLHEKKLQSEIQLHSRRRKISPKTVTSYLGTANRQIIPVWGDLDIRKITTEKLQQHFDELDYSEKYLKDIRLILRLTFQKAIDLGVISENPASKVYIGNRKSNIGVEIEHLDKERQAVWLDLFEKDGRQWAYLFEAILLSRTDVQKNVVHSNLTAF